MLKWLCSNAVAWLMLAIISSALNCRISETECAEKDKQNESIENNHFVIGKNENRTKLATSIVGTYMCV